MEPKPVLQLVVALMAVIGIVGVAASFPGSPVPFFWSGEEALLVGGGFLAIAVVMLADLRRRNWGESERPATGPR